MPRAVDVELYGGMRGFLEHTRSRAMYALGAYGDTRKIEWTAVRRLVFVCRGNICRSPYASIKARSLGVSAASFGLDAIEGAPANPAASKNALLRGVDMSLHRSARLESSRLVAGDLVIAFEPGHLPEIRRRNANRSATLLGIWARQFRPHIQDPYGRSDRYFQECFAVIDASITRLVERMARGSGPASGEERCDGAIV